MSALSANVCDSGKGDEKNLKVFFFQKLETFLIKSDLSQHISTVHVEKNLKCNDCEYSTSKPYLLKKHIHDRHSGLVFNCDMCGLTFSSAVNLK